VRAREIENIDGRRTFAIVFDVGDEVTEKLLAFAREHRIRGAYFTAIGALEDVTLGFWDGDRKEYRRIPVNEQVEVLSLMGNVALESDGPKVHAHIVVGKADGTAHGGHLLQGHVRPTLEIILIEAPSHLRRRFDARTGLALLDPGA
jgi:predicted DNA-binding protein with PD1-like motif